MLCEIKLNRQQKKKKKELCLTTHGISTIQGFTEFLQSVQELHVVFSFVGCIRDVGILFSPQLK